MKITLEDSSAIIPIKEALSRDAQEKIESIYNYIENSILYPLRMVSSPEEADDQFEELFPKYERVRATINTLLVDALGEKGFQMMEQGIEGELSSLPTNDLLAEKERESILESFEQARSINSLLNEAASNTEDLDDDGLLLEGLPESRKNDFQELITLIGKWELALTVASTAVLTRQGESEIIDHYIGLSCEFIENGKDKLKKLVKKCSHCNKSFLIRRTNQKYCSKSCLNKARNKRYREGQEK